ncbi:helix-turn-helix transcriptional regulator [Celeribacter sp.]|uniref:helix-turn-helix transcriptional regulator n=1 Tax=Celeribacter sp. TaxID=1890673 RepID=UPI003A9103F7
MARIEPTNTDKKPRTFSRVPKLAIPDRAILISQVIFTSLFLFKILADYLALPLYMVPWSVMEGIEITASIGMLLGVFTSFVLVSQGQARVKSVEKKIEAASGELNDYLVKQFDDWALSPTERHVAVLLIKGFSNQEIADIRGTSESTVKSQVTTIFRKSGVSSRGQLVTWVLEDVIDRLSSDAPVAT